MDLPLGTMSQIQETAAELWGGGGGGEQQTEWRIEGIAFRAGSAIRKREGSSSLGRPRDRSSGVEEEDRGHIAVQPEGAAMSEFS